MATPKQLAANSKNASKSTGPKTCQGKQIASRNATRHTMLSTRLIIPELEKKKDWDAHKQAIMESLNPSGGLEKALAERIVTSLWRLNRVARYEVETIHISQESAIEAVAHKRKYQNGILEELDENIAHPVKAAEQAESASEDERLITKLLKGNNLESFTDEEGRWLIQIAFDYTKNVKKIPDEHWPPKQTGFTGWNKEIIVRVLRWVAQNDGQDPSQFMTAMVRGTNSALLQAKKHAEEASRDLDCHRREHLLPPWQILEHICRYETHLHRAFQRDLHELQRLQAARQGNYVQPPVVLDVDVTTADAK